MQNIKEQNEQYQLRNCSTQLFLLLWFQGFRFGNRPKSKMELDKGSQ